MAERDADLRPLRYFLVGKATSIAKQGGKYALYWADTKTHTIEEHRRVLMAMIDPKDTI